MAEQVFPRSPFAAAGGRVIAAPFEFYTTGEDNLRVTSFNAVAGVSLKIDLRTIDLQGVIGAHSHDHTPNADRSAKTSDIGLGAGAVMNITVFANAGSPLIGQTFVIVQLIRGIGPAAIILGTLLQGYVTQRQALGWPGSPIRSSLDVVPPIRLVNSGVPALGVDWHFDVPAGARWQVESIYAQFATVGAVARTAVLQISQSGQTTALIAPQANQSGAVTINYTWAPNLPYSLPFSTGVLSQPMPDPTQLNAGDQIEVLTLAITAFDQWSNAVARIRESLEAQT